MKSKAGRGKRLGTAGAAAGALLFVPFGLLHGSLTGGVIGLDIVNSLYSTAADPTAFAKVIMAGCMVAGLLVALAVFVVGGFVLGYTTGSASAILDCGVVKDGVKLSGGR